MIYEIYMRYTCLLSRKNNRYPNYQLYVYNFISNPAFTHALRGTYRARLSATKHQFFPGGGREKEQTNPSGRALFFFFPVALFLFSNCALQASWSVLGI
ncbi:hypothetical protein J3F84DRAFT_372892 [Trichoderma pleuroticola]